MKSEGVSDTSRSDGPGSDRPRFDGPHLYLHIPFCRYRCDYCDFFTRTSVSAFRQEAIVQRIIEQSDWCNIEPANLETVYVGGGTPSTLAEGARKHLFSYLYRLAAAVPVTESSRQEPAFECTVEVNPEDVTVDLLHEMEEHGVNRLSVGIQSLSPLALSIMGRHTSPDETVRGLDTIARHWNGRWSADIIVAIPGMTAEDVTEDVYRIMDRGPGHVSLYELGIEDRTILGLRKRRGTISPSDEGETLIQLQTGANLLGEFGLRRYEISSFAVPGDESRHNLGYWKMAPHLGLGPGAVGTFPLRPGGSSVRMTNTRSFRSFLQQEDFGVELERIGRIDRAKELVMMGFRTIIGVDAATFRDLAGDSFRRICATSMSEWPGAFAVSETGSIRLRTQWWDRLDTILVSLFRDIDSFHLK